MDLSADAERFLRHIVEHPFVTVTNRYDDAFPSRYKGDQARQELEETGLIEGKDVVTGDSRIKLFQLSDEAKQYLQEQGIDVNWPGRGGIVHKYWQTRIQRLVEDAGGTAVREKNDADSHAERDGETVAYEVAMAAREREVDHVQE